ncbi:N-acetylmuramoyl-L-alanine amidase LytC precursor [Oxobacter pfennigii]|uniref:N-acetylmuramoyl-L-alanine amidase LytC n=1 Tax=Oxobacter pfennigii TaxID=36849 RepID=A0A0P8W9T6_9CLOT|nr:cell wall-binding repeat-containing protein [Oxobacter pfennigii]KPU44461.1 N-acetylmuramoyl-L-alanine amidase LytC precursor [Oxobacter pfennigii]
MKNKRILSLIITAAILFSLLPGGAYYAVAADTTGAGHVMQVYQKVEMSGGYALALKTDGTVWFWGYEIRPDQGGWARSRPGKIEGLNEIVSISAGDSHAAALKEDGTVWSWGNNGSGQLGDGTRGDKATPVMAVGLDDVISISSGGMHTLALKKDGTVWAWGDNSKGQLGDGTQVNGRTPVKVAGLADVAAIYSGYAHSMAVKKDGTVWAFGDNSKGQLGDGTTEDRLLPVKINISGDVLALSLGREHSAALKKDRTVWAWGDNSKGQLGDGTNIQKSSPVMVKGLSNIKMLSSGWYHSMALKEDGSVWTWGANNSGQLGTGSMEDKNIPVKVQGLWDIRAVDAGYDTSLVIKTDSTVWSWGNNESGQLADGTIYNSKYSPIQANVDVDFPKIVSSSPNNEDKDIAVFKSITVKFSENVEPGISYNNITVKDYSGSVVEMNKELSKDILTITPRESLKNDAAYTVSIPEGAVIDKEENRLLEEYKFGFTTGNALSTAANIDEVSPGNNERHVVLDSKFTLKFNKSIIAGENFEGIGIKDEKNNNIEISKGISDNTIILTPKSPLVLNTRYTVTIPSGAVKYNEGGALTGDYVSSFTTLEPSDIVAVSAGKEHSLALRADGKLYVWGSNEYGQLGNGMIFSSIPHSFNTPFPVPDLTDVAAVSAGENHSLALKKDGTVYSWGFNMYGTGEIDPTYVDLYGSPYKVPGLQNIIAVSAGKDYSMALQNDGTVWTWYSNMYDDNGGSLPEKVPGLTDVTAIAAGNDRFLALKEDGTVWAWGNNLNEALGVKGNGEIPSKVIGLADVASIDTGEEYNVALKKDGTMYVWGKDAAYIASGARGIKDAAAVSAGYSHITVLKKDGTGWFWGESIMGNAQYAISEARKIDFPDGARAFSSGRYFDIAIGKDSSVWAFGVNRSGQLGDGTNNNTEYLVKALPSNIPFKINYIQPYNNSTYAQAFEPVIIAFNKNIIEGDNYGSIAIKDGTGSVPVKKEIDKNILTITPLEDLEYSKGYTVELPQDAVKDDGGSILKDDLKFSFTTVRPKNAENPPLLVRGTYPEDGMEITGADDAITVNFNMEIAGGTNYSSINVRDSGGNTVPSSVSFKNSRLTIKPDTILNAGETYTVTLPAGSVKDSYKGMVLEEDNSFEFSVKAVPEGKISRYAGNNRYETSIKISQAGWTSSQNVVLATGEDFPDALSAAPLAEKLDAPILLTDKTALRSSLGEELERLGARNIFIIGGEGAVSKSVKDELERKGMSVIRLSGNDRYDTSLKVADYMNTNFGISREIVVATGNDFPDALSIAPVAAKKGMPIILTPRSELPENIKEYIDINGITKAFVVGGTGVISDAVANKLPDGERINGNDRYETNIAVLERFKDDLDFGSIYVSTGNDFPDALAGSVLATKTLSPIVLTGKQLEQKTKDFIEDNMPQLKEVKALGGEGVVPSSALLPIAPVSDNIGGETGDMAVYGTEAVFSGGFIYYNDNVENGFLYKIKDDLTGRVKLSNDSPRYINVMEGWIYYVNQSDDDKLYKIKADGNQRTKLTDYSVWNIRVSGDWIYYVRDDSPNMQSPRLYRIKTDGAGNTKVSDDWIMGFAISEGFIYYSGSSDYDRTYRMKLDGTGKQSVINNSVYSLDVVGEWIFYSRETDTGDTAIYKSKSDGTGDEILIAPRAYKAAVLGDFVYYCNGLDGYKLYRIRTDGSENIRLDDDNRSYGFNLAGDWLYYMNSSKGSIFYNTKTGEEVINRPID